MSGKSSTQRIRERILRRADLRDAFADMAPEDQKRLVEISELLKQTGRNMRAPQLRALELEVKIIFAKLAKVVPDEKIIEHELGDGILNALSDDEMDRRITELLTKAGMTHDRLIELVRKAGARGATAASGETSTPTTH